MRATISRRALPLFGGNNRLFRRKPVFRNGMRIVVLTAMIFEHYNSRQAKPGIGLLTKFNKGCFLFSLFNPERNAATARVVSVDKNHRNAFEFNHGFDFSFEGFFQECRTISVTSPEIPREMNSSNMSNTVNMITGYRLRQAFLCEKLANFFFRCACIIRTCNNQEVVLTLTFFRGG